MPRMMKISELRHLQSGDYDHMTMGDYADLPLEFFDSFEKICYYSSETVKDLMEDIRGRGMVHPVIVNLTGKFVNGHHRYWCAAQLGLDEIPVITHGEENYTGSDW